MSKQSYSVFPLGYIRKSKAGTYLEILEDYVPALKQLEHFSHAQLLWWLGGPQKGESRCLTRLQSPYQGSDTGVFALRRTARPNPIALTTIEVLAVDHKRGVVQVSGTGAAEGTPVLDVKAHIPVEDRIEEVRTPRWMNDWPEWLCENGGVLASSRRPKEDPSVYERITSDDFDIYPVGEIRRHDGQTLLEIQEPFNPALAGLEEFSHVRILWWFDRLDNDRFRRITHNKPPYENAPVTGVFASRSPVRPNPLGLTTARIMEIDKKRGAVLIAGLDAFDKTPIVDLKPYIPSLDRVKIFKVPKWIAHWSVWHREYEEVETVSPDNLRPADIDRLAAFQTARPAARTTGTHAGTTIRQTGTRVNSDAILIRGARQHNLKNIDVTIPRNKLTVITGVSGSGKSSLAFDTLYAEGRRRYIGNLSTIARRLIGQMEKPRVDHILGLAPTIAIQQGNISRNPRSTVGTITDIQDYLRVLFARVGIRHCPQCGRAVKPQTARRITDQLTALIPGTRFQLLAPLVRSLEGTHTAILDQARSSSRFNLRIDGKTYDLQNQDVSLKETEPHIIDWIIEDLIVPEQGQKGFHNRVFKAAESGLEAGGGYLTVVLEDETEIVLSGHLDCPHCNIFFFELSPALFSFNNPDGMCPDCNGLGTKLSVDPDQIITDPDLSLLDGASPWYGELRKIKPSGNWMRSELFALAENMKVDLELPWRKLPKTFRQAVLNGTGAEIITWTYDMKNRGRSISFARPVQGAVNNIKRLLKQTRSEGARGRLLQFMTEKPCPTCGGERLCTEARFVTVGGTRFPELASMNLAQVHQWAATLSDRLNPEQRRIAAEIIEELSDRLASLVNLGLHYLSLNRHASTLSGGESQRIRLATQLGSDLTGLLYVLDEPSIGLHPRDHKALLTTLSRLRDAGNTVVVVEHDEQTMRAADWLIDLGPGAGSFGGEVIGAGTPKEVIADPSSLTGRYLSGELKVVSANRKDEQASRGRLKLVGARLHNLKGISAEFPLGRLSCVTGVSGSGKSSLVTQTLAPALARTLHGRESISGPCSRIEGLERINEVITVTQASIGRTPRSTPGTYVGVFDEVRKVFAGTPEAKSRKFNTGRFSFNSKEGRCPVCEGQGRKRIEMHFLSDVWVTCSECEGKRYNRETLEITYKGKSIADVLDMDVDDALGFFESNPAILTKLQTLQDVGLGYIKIGQSALTLSGGEAQRVKLAKELSRPDTGCTVYILDEPTTGLHFADIQKLVDVLHRLTGAGNTVIIIEHNLDVIRTADWIIDLGPEGGDEGGYIVAQGSPEEIMKFAESHTARFLRQLTSEMTAISRSSEPLAFYQSANRTPPAV